MNLIPWFPRLSRTDLATLPQLMDRWLEGFWREPLATDLTASKLWEPAMDVYETDKEVVVKAELPGLEPKEIEVSLRDGELEVKGEKKQEKEVKERGYHRVERFYGAFHRRVALPAEVEADKAKAEYKQGILQITLPKAPEAQAKQVKIEVN